ncbi:hypothetical protein AeMF1_013886 [Aphanomyces euteiches]|nr:hypothetical protein AeMF1_013886 [Aphanomyces euteiches]KAH9194927.1 hypothetical protein AeNC1_003101 [Aphanomyces euteiches]
MSTAIEAARAKTKGKTLLKQVLNAYDDIDSLEASASAISEWNRRKRDAVENGTWIWRESTATYALPKVKVAPYKVKTQLASFKTLSDELFEIVHRPFGHSQEDPPQISKICAWSAVVDGKFYTCSNELHSVVSISTRRCNWHALSCRDPTHSRTLPTSIAIANLDGKCLVCYANARSNLPKHKRSPPSFDTLSIPGVHRSEADNVQAKVTVGDRRNAVDKQPEFTKTSVCTWKGYKPDQKTFEPFTCHHAVLQHPVLLSYLGVCGFHQTTCVRNHTKGVVCPPITPLNAYGLCQNHYQAYVTTLSFVKRRADQVYSSPFDPPDVYAPESAQTKTKKTIAAHPLAPKYPPPAIPEQVPIQPKSLFASWFQSSVIHFFWWQINYLRHGPRMATKLQAVFRGNQARKRVRQIRRQENTRKRIKAAIFIQKYWRSKQTRREIVAYRNVRRSTSIFLQRVARGSIARSRVRHLRVFRRLASFVGIYLAIHRFVRMLHDRVDVRRALTRISDRDRLKALYMLQRRRAAKVLARAMRAWKQRKMDQLRHGELRFKSFMAALTIQRSWKRYRKLQNLHIRYSAAQRIQARIRGSLTRCLWSRDPGISCVVQLINPLSGFVYVKYSLDPTPSPSYSVIRRSLRRDLAARILQRVMRGFLGRLVANTVWANMEKRWNWIDPTQNRAALRTLVPSVNYHETKQHHMRRIYNLPSAQRGYEYEFQGVVDLFEDRNGRRCSPIPRRKLPSPSFEPQIESPVSAASSMFDLASPPTLKSMDKSQTTGISSTMALYPVGSLVYVRLARGKLHPARITHIHRESEAFDIRFLPGLVSMRGVGITEATNIHVSRLQYDPPPPQTPSLTSRIRSELLRLKQSVPSTFTKIDKSHLRKPPWTSKTSRYRDIVTIIRNTHESMLTDPALWMQFVFDHRDLLEQCWMHLVHDIQHGTTSSNEFSRQSETSRVPLPHVADLLRAKLIALGFQASPSACHIPPEQVSLMENAKGHLGYQRTNQLIE